MKDLFDRCRCLRDHIRRRFVQRDLFALAPQTEQQRWLRSNALKITSTIAEPRWTTVEQALAGPILVMIEMDQPYSGLVKIPSASLRVALDQLGQL